MILEFDKTKDGMNMKGAKGLRLRIYRFLFNILS